MLGIKRYTENGADVHFPTATTQSLKLYFGIYYVRFMVDQGILDDRIKPILIVVLALRMILS